MGLPGDRAGQVTQARGAGGDGETQASQAQAASEHPAIAVCLVRPIRTIKSALTS